MGGPDEEERSMFWFERVSAGREWSVWESVAHHVAIRLSNVIWVKCVNTLQQFYFYASFSASSSVLYIWCRRILRLAIASLIAHRSSQMPQTILIASMSPFPTSARFFLPSTTAPSSPKPKSIYWTRLAIMPANEDAKKNPESESSKTAALSAEDRRAITEGLFEASVAQSLTDAGLESQRKRRNLRGGMPSCFPILI